MAEFDRPEVAPVADYTKPGWSYQTQSYGRESDSSPGWNYSPAVAMAAQQKADADYLAKNRDTTITAKNGPMSGQQIRPIFTQGASYGGKESGDDSLTPKTISGYGFMPNGEHNYFYDTEGNYKFDDGNTTARFNRSMATGLGAFLGAGALSASGGLSGLFGGGGGGLATESGSLLGTGGLGGAGAAAGATGAATAAGGGSLSSLFSSMPSLSNIGSIVGLASSLGKVFGGGGSGGGGSGGGGVSGTQSSADPYAAYRPAAAAEYARALTPGAAANIESMPGYTQYNTGVMQPALEASQRAAASKGQLYSGGEMQALQKTGQAGYTDFMNNYLNRLATASGAGASPYNAASLATQQQNLQDQSQAQAIGALPQQLQNLSKMFGGSSNNPTGYVSGGAGTNYQGYDYSTPVSYEDMTREGS